MAQTTTSIVWAICFVFVCQRWFGGGGCVCVDGGGRGLESWEPFVVVGVTWQMVPLLFFSGAHDHMVCAWPQGI
jgi:hypothetical protein